MWNTSEVTKLSDLRDKTDRQLIAVIDHQLDHGLSSDEVRAEAAYCGARRLLTVAYGMSYADRRRLELKLARLGNSLSRACACVA